MRLVEPGSTEWLSSAVHLISQIGEREECVGANEWNHGSAVLNFVAFKSQEHDPKLSLPVSGPCLSGSNAEFAAFTFASHQPLVCI